MCFYELVVSLEKTQIEFNDTSAVVLIFLWVVTIKSCRNRLFQYYE